MECVKCRIALDANNCCPRCGVWYGDPCPECRKSGYHAIGCAILAREKKPAHRHVCTDCGRTEEKPCENSGECIAPVHLNGDHCDYCSDRNFDEEAEAYGNHVQMQIDLAQGK